MTRLGVVLAPWAGEPAGRFVAVAREAEGRGYHTAWAGEVGGADAITLMAMILGGTERLGAATGVLPIQTRTPVLLGMTAATLDRMAPGRFALGLGLSSRVIVGDWHGLPFANSVAQMREAVQIIRLVASGERASFEGAFYRLRNFRLAASARPVRIILAALGPEMLELAGEVADGVLLNWIPPAAVPASVRHLEAGARRAGRRLDGFEVAAFVRTCVTDDVEAAHQTLARDITGYATVDVYASFFRGAGFAAEVDALTEAWKGGDRAWAVRHVSARVLDGLGVVGPEGACRDRIEAFARAGLTMPVVVPFVPAGSADPAGALLRTLRAFP